MPPNLVFRSIYRIYVKGLIISLELLDVLEIFFLDLYDYVYTKRLYNLFFSSTVVLYGIFCGARNSNKLELVNKRALRLVLGDRSSSYSALLSRLDMVSLRVRESRTH